MSNTSKIGRAKVTTNADDKTVDDPFEFSITRIIDAPRELVYRMWSESEHMSRWCFPKGFTLPDATMEFHPGGTYMAHMRAPDGSDFRVLGTYLEIVPKERIVFTHGWINEAGERGHETVVNITFEDHGEATKLTLNQSRFQSAESRDSHEGGWSETVDNLVSYLPTIQDMSN